MMTPDFALIAEITLFAEGFEQSKALARKMAAVMDLSQQQLSKQDHYDYGGQCREGCAAALWHTHPWRRSMHVNRGRMRSLHDWLNWLAVDRAAHRRLRCQACAPL